MGLSNGEVAERWAKGKGGSSNHMFTDGGVCYSYGYHFPLLFKVNGVSFCNMRRYSTATSGHQCHARQYADHAAELYGHLPMEEAEIVEWVHEALIAEYEELLPKVHGCSRVNDHRIERLCDIARAVKAVFDAQHRLDAAAATEGIWDEIPTDDRIDEAR